MKFVIILLLFNTANFSSSGQVQSADLKQKIKLLQPFEGRWAAEVKLHTRTGVTIEEAGTYKISWALDTTYLQWHADLRNKKDSSRWRNFLIMMTYNPDSNRYENLYLYRASAMKVFERGTFNAGTREYTTTAFIPLEDGAHDEFVRTITKISSNNDRIDYSHYSRYHDEKKETLDFEAVLKRIR